MMGHINKIKLVEIRNISKNIRIVECWMNIFLKKIDEEIFDKIRKLNFPNLKKDKKIKRGLYRAQNNR